MYMHINIHDICIYDMRYVYIWHYIDTCMYASLYIYTRIYKGDYDIQRTPLDLPTIFNSTLLLAMKLRSPCFYLLHSPKTNRLQGLPMKLDGLEDDPFLLERPILSSWWFQLIWNIFVKMDHFPNFRGENRKYLSCHHPVTNFQRATC